MKDLKRMLTYNIKTLISFEFLYKVLSSLIFMPLFLNGFKLITKVCGYSYLTFENFFSFLTNPLVILSLLILLILITFYTLIDIGVVIIILDSSYNKKKIGIKDALIVMLSRIKRIFKLKNILLPFLVIFLIPFLHIGLSSSFIGIIKIPEFILDYILKNKLLLSIYLVVICLLIYLFFRWIYALHYFILEDCEFKEARKRSINLSKKNKIKDFLFIILGEFIISLAYILFVFLGIILIIGIYKILGKANILGNASITIIWLLIAVSFIVIETLVTPISYAIISSLYYKHKNKISEKIIHVNIEKKEKTVLSKKIKYLKYGVILLVIISGTILTYNVTNGGYDLKIEYVRQIDVTAHRGASVYYPENTISAFKGAKALGADYIELDIQQTKDRKLIVLHDTNLKRTTGVNKNTWETSYNEIKELDAGSFFSEEFKGEKIPLFEEVLKFSRDNNIKLNIELKPTGKEVDFEKSVVDLVKKYHLEKNCVVTSQVYEVLENIKKYDKDIKTVYVMSLAYGDILKLKSADCFSIEASSINKPLVKKIHNAGKELYAWTVNTKESINKMIELNVDNIITDDITLAKETIYLSKTSNVIQEYIKFVNNLFK